MTQTLTPAQEKMVLIGETFNELDLGDQTVVGYLLIDRIMKDHELVLSEEWVTKDESEEQCKQQIIHDRDMIGLSLQFLRQTFFVQQYESED